MKEQSRKKAGRPASQKRRAELAKLRLLIENRPSYALDVNAYPDWVSHLGSSEPLNAVRKTLGLSHKTIPDALVFAELAVDEGAGESFANETKKWVANRKEQIGSSTKKGGQKLPAASLQKMLTDCDDAIGIFSQFKVGLLSYKDVAKMLANLRLPVPADRTLRRWKKLKIGH